MEIVQAYLFLQNARFEGGFTFNNELTAEVLQKLIPPFTLQLLVENCIKHNVVSVDQPLHIRLYADGEFIIMENPIRLKMGGHDSLGVGLKNIEMRYRHLLEKQVEISNDGSLFQIKLPVIYEYHHH
jgi:LytS/YehU family sensor histidine kinase